MSNPYRQAHYTISATQLSELPDDKGREVAFAGRSNAGKSSAINAITEQKALARVSKTPGRTQMINFFSLDEQHALVDLPGYGYAKVSKSSKRIFQKFITEYFEQRKQLIAAFVLPAALLTMNWTWAALASHYLGMLLERWLFFVEAKHVIRHYYST